MFTLIEFFSENTLLHQFNCRSIRFGRWHKGFSFWWKSTGKEILVILQFKSTSCIFYSNFHYGFSYWSISYKVGVCSIGLRGVNILVFSPLLYSWLRTCMFHLAVAKLNWFSKWDYITLFHLKLNHLIIFLNFYQHEHPKFEPLERKLNIQYEKFTSCEAVSELEDSLLVFDDSCEDIFNDRKFSKLANAGRLKNKCFLR